MLIVFGSAFALHVLGNVGNRYKTKELQWNIGERFSCF